MTATWSLDFKDVTRRTRKERANMVLSHGFERVSCQVGKQLKLLDFIQVGRRLCIVPNADLEGGVFL
jgi:hypothetical protein